MTQRSHHAPLDEPSAPQSVGKRLARHAERDGYVSKLRATSGDRQTGPADEKQNSAKRCNRT